jgi:hypothetical protein
VQQHVGFPRGGEAVAFQRCGAGRDRRQTGGRTWRGECRGGRRRCRCRCRRARRWRPRGWWHWLRGRRRTGGGRRRRCHRGCGRRAEGSKPAGVSRCKALLRTRRPASRRNRAGQAAGAPLCPVALRQAYGIGPSGIAFHRGRIGLGQLGIELSQPRRRADHPIRRILCLAAVEALRTGDGWQQPRNDDTCQADTAAPPKRDAAVWQRNTWAGSYHVWDSGSVGRVAVMARPIGATAGRGGLTHADRNIANTLAHHCRFCAGGGVVRRAIR